jgi:dTMP kinase
MRRAMFISFEGIEGSGKSVQISQAEAYLKSKGVPCLATREPGGTDFGASVRRILLCSSVTRLEPMSELLLYLADRIQHLKQVIEPALERGVTVLSDRYHDATRAYQGAARGIPAEVIDELASVLGIREPDRTILIDLEPEIGLERALSRNRKSAASLDEGRFEAEELPFHRRVRESYLELACRFPERITVVSGAAAPQEVFGRIAPFFDHWFDLER